MLPTGTVLNGLFEVRRLVARGNVAAIYEGVSVTTGERVAIKAFHPSIAGSAETEDFLAQMRGLPRLVHPAIANYRIVGREPTHGVLYVVHEYVDGIPLTSFIGQVTVSEANLRTVARRLAEGLKHAHELGVVHRAITPDNIIAPNGKLDESKIVDFGLTNRGVRGSSPDGTANSQYEAPEQSGAFESPVGPWTDVYSLGLVLFTLATGRLPRDKWLASQLQHGGRSGLDLSKTPSQLRRLFAGMLAADPASRFRAMDDVLRVLNAKPRPSRRSPSRLRTRRSR
jgi:serine/threonine-protein kinase